MNDQTENKLLLAARILLMALLLWLISGRAAVGADLSLIAVLFLVRSIMLRGWNWARCTWFKIGLSPWAWILPITDFIRASAITFSQVVLSRRFLFFASALVSCGCMSRMHLSGWRPVCWCSPCLAPG